MDECFFRFEIGSKSIKHGSAIVRLTFGVAPISRFSEDSKTRILKFSAQFYSNLTVKTVLLSTPFSIEYFSLKTKKSFESLTVMLL